MSKHQIFFASTADVMNKEAIDRQDILHFEKFALVMVQLQLTSDVKHGELTALQVAEKQWRDQFKTLEHKERVALGESKLDLIERLLLCDDETGAREELVKTEQSESRLLQCVYQIDLFELRHVAPA